MASSRIEELPDDFDEKLLVTNPPDTSTLSDGTSRKPTNESPMESSKASKDETAKETGGVPMPPAMQEVKESTADEVLDLMNRMPLFMTDLDTAEDGENIQLEAIKALAYEGTRSEIAGNFREQGNEAAKTKQWVDAREFYDRALQTLAMSEQQLVEAKGGEGKSDFEVLDVNEADERRKCVQVREASLVNRALCNLEMKNYGACNRDCATALKMNPGNVKAWYRSATACLALDKTDQARDACDRGLEVDAKNAALKTLSAKIDKRQAHLNEMQRLRTEREERKRREEVALKDALRSRKILSRSTKDAPDMEDAVMKLDDPIDPKSTLRFPVVLLYPLHAQTDFIKQFAESENISSHLEYIFPLPWDEKAEYQLDHVDCYVETVSGGLVKAGKNMALLKILGSGKVELVDGMLRISVVPRSRAQEWIDDVKMRKGR